MVRLSHNGVRGHIWVSLQSPTYDLIEHALRSFREKPHDWNRGINNIHDALRRPFRDLFGLTFGTINE